MEHMTTTQSPEYRPTWATRRIRIPGQRTEAHELIAAFTKDYSPETARVYRRHLRIYVAWLDRWPMLHPYDASPDDIDQHLEYLSSNHWTHHPGPCVEECERLPYGKENKDHARTAISQFYDYLTERHREFVQFNPVPKQRGRKPRGSAAEIGAKDIFQPHEYWSLYEAARDDHPRSELCVAMLLGTGMRPEEMHLARVENLGTRAGGKIRTLKLMRVKKGGGYWQTIDLGYKLYPILDRCLAGRTSGPFLLGRKIRNKDTGELEQNALDTSGIRRLFYRLGEAAGIQPAAGELVNPYMARDTFITLGLTQPGDVLTIHRLSRYVGHEDPRMTMKYYNTANLLTTGVHPNIFGPDWRTQAP
jgi:integrase